MSLLSLAVAEAPTPSVTDWLSVILSSIAIVIGVIVAGYVAVQSHNFHTENRRHEAETYSRERYESLVGTGVAILDAARQVQSATSERWAQLLGIESVPDSPGDDEDRLQVSSLLATLEVRAELLVLSESLLPEPPHKSDAARLNDALATLRHEAAWLVGDAHMAAISFFGGPEYNEQVSGTRAEISSSLVHESIQNISRRLLFGHVKHVPYWRQPDSPWPKEAEKRIAVVLKDDPEAASERRFESRQAPEANAMLASTIDRFSTALFGVIDECELLRDPSKRSPAAGRLPSGSPAPEAPRDTSSLLP